MNAPPSAETPAPIDTSATGSSLEPAVPPESRPSETAEEVAADPPLIEIGWVLAGRLDEDDRTAIRIARRRMIAELERLFPDFRWRLGLVERRAIAAERRYSPERLLDIGVIERDIHRWDFTFVVTDADLLTYEKSFALGAPSRAVSAAVLSTARLLPNLEEADEPVATKARRLYSLGMHLLGHLVNLGDEPADRDDFMFDFGRVADLDDMQHFAAEDLERLAIQLRAVGDLRLEETASYRGRVLLFYLKAMWYQRREIASSVVRIGPWFFPLRFSRLTTAAASTLVLMSVTAESWELGLRQPPERVGAISLASLVLLAWFLVERQKLFGAHRGRELREQRVVADVSIALALFLGLTTVYAILFLAAFGLGTVFFDPALVESWTPTIETIGLRERLGLAGFVAFLGLMVGSLGASFEEQSYFRHVTLVDEET